MKTFHFFILFILTLFFNSCKKDDVREEQPGTPTSISGNIKDYHRNIYINNFEVKLEKYWPCSTGIIYTTYCSKKITSTLSDADGNYQLDFEYNLRDDEKYMLVFNENGSEYYFHEFVSPTGEFYRDFNPDNIIEGENNILNLNAWIPIKLKFNLTVHNNHTPPLITGIKYNGESDFGTEFTYDDFKTFEMKTRPNSDIDIKFWYIENYNSSNPIFHYAPVVHYHTSDNPLTELNFEIDYNDF